MINPFTFVYYIDFFDVIIWWVVALIGAGVFFFIGGMLLDWLEDACRRDE